MPLLKDLLKPAVKPKVKKISIESKLLFDTNIKVMTIQEIKDYRINCYEFVM